MSTTTAFQIEPIPAEVFAHARAGGTDASGNAVERIVATGGEPLRCCMHDAEAGETMILFGYEPPLPASPYREIGAVYGHAEPCGGPESTGYPPAWYGRAQVLRAYDERGWIHPATRVHEGINPEATIADILADPAVACIHSRNIAHGCFMFTIVRADRAARSGW